MNIYFIVAIGTFFVLETLALFFFLAKYLEILKKTPAKVFLRAYKKKLPILAKLSDKGFLVFENSESQDMLMTKGKVIFQSPYSLYTEVNSKSPVFFYYGQLTKDSKTLNVESAIFAQEVDKLTKEKGMSEEEAIKHIQKEVAKKGAYTTQYGPIEFKHITDFFGYEDSSDTYAVANRLASEKLHSQQSLMKNAMLYFVIITTIVVLLVGFVALYKLLAINPHVTVSIPQMANMTQQVAKNITLKP